MQKDEIRFIDFMKFDKPSEMFSAVSLVELESMP